MSDRKSDGFLISETIQDYLNPYLREKLASRINRIIRRRMAEAWDEGYDNNPATFGIKFEEKNPYRGRKKKEDGR